MAGNSHGFAAAYLGFYLLIPFLSIIRDHISHNVLLLLIAILFYFQVGSQIISGITGYAPPILSNEVTLFVFFYFLILYYKRYHIREKINRTILLCTFVAIWIFSYFTYFIGFTNPSSKVFKYLLLLVRDESSLLYIVGGIALFFLFNNSKVFYNNKINLIAKSMFGILLFHDHNFFRPVLWHEVLKSQLFYQSQWFVVWVLVSTVLIFTFGAIFDFIPRRLTTYLLTKKYFIELSRKFNIFIAE